MKKEIKPLMNFQKNQIIKMKKKKMRKIKKNLKKILLKKQKMNID